MEISWKRSQLNQLVTTNIAWLPVDKMFSPIYQPVEEFSFTAWKKRWDGAECVTIRAHGGTTIQIVLLTKERNNNNNNNNILFIIWLWILIALDAQVEVLIEAGQG